MKRKRFGFWLISAALAALSVYLGGSSANEGLRFRRISTAQGLSQSMGKVLLRDSKGYIWIGAQDGLNRYDGYRFEIYRPDASNPHAISHNEIYALMEDRDGYIWVGTARGLNRYDRNTQQFKKYPHRPDQPGGIGNDVITSLLQTRDGAIWIGSGRGLVRHDPKTGAFRAFRREKNNPGALAGDMISSLCEDQHGTLWIGTFNGLSRMTDREKGVFQSYQSHLGDLSGLNGDLVTCLLEDRHGLFWVGTLNGLHLMDRSAGTFTLLQANSKIPGRISSDAIACLCEDPAGTVWIGTPNGGLNRYNRENKTFSVFTNDPRDPHSIGDNNILSLCCDNAGGLWVGTFGSGVSRGDPHGVIFKSIAYDPNDPNSISAPYVFGLAEDPGGDIWIGLNNGGVNRLNMTSGKNRVYRANPADPRAISHDTILGIHRDRDNDIWIATAQGLCRYNRDRDNFTVYRADPLNPQSLSSDVIYNVVSGSRDCLWIATVGNGLNRFDKKTGQFKHYRYQPGTVNSLNHDAIRSVAEDRAGHVWVGTMAGLNRLDPTTGDVVRFEPGTAGRGPNSDTIMWICPDPGGRLWLATFGGGLNLFDPRSGRFSYYGEKDGLANDVVYVVEPDGQGYLWLSTNKGLSRFDPRTREFRNFNTDDGLIGDEFNSNAFCRDREGRFYFGGAGGVNYFKPEDLKKNHLPPPVAITGFLLFNRPAGPGPGSPLARCIEETREISLTYRQNVFSFEFAALNFTTPEKNRYKYKLEGFDPEWIETGASKRFAHYTNIDHGEYVFRVTAANNDGVWNEQGASVRLVITPPYWKTWPFRLGVLAVVILLGFGAYRRRMSNLLREMRLEAELQTARDAQMSIMPQADPRLPHFEVSGVCVPAFEVGGDFFDYIWMDEERRRFLVAIGDVSGKAMKAAMTAVMSSGMLYSKIHNSGSVREIVTEMNRPLYEKIDRRMFTALCLAAIDLREKQLVFVNAGLNEPLLKSGADATPLESSGPRFPLGSKPDNRYEETSVRLHDGDVVVLYTDGITEAMNGAEEFYGFASLRNLVLQMDTAVMSAEEIKIAIINDVRRFAGGAPPHDDMTVVVIKLNC